MASRLTNPRVHVVLVDGREWDVQTINPDIIRFESTARQHKWSGPSESPVTWLTFLAWAASTRTGDLEGVTWDEFSKTLCAEVSAAPKTNGSTEVPPTQPVPGIE